MVQNKHNTSKGSINLKLDSQFLSDISFKIPM